MDTTFALIGAVMAAEVFWFCKHLKAGIVCTTAFAWAFAAVWTMSYMAIKVHEANPDALVPAMGFFGFLMPVAFLGFPLGFAAEYINKARLRAKAL